MRDFLTGYSLAFLQKGITIILVTLFFCDKPVTITALFSKLSSNLLFNDHIKAN